MKREKLLVLRLCVALVAVVRQDIATGSRIHSKRSTSDPFNSSTITAVTAAAAIRTGTFTVTVTGTGTGTGFWCGCAVLAACRSCHRW